MYLGRTLKGILRGTSRGLQEGVQEDLEGDLEEDFRGDFKQDLCLMAHNPGLESPECKSKDRFGILRFSASRHPV